MGPLGLRYTVFQAFLVLTSLSAATMRYTTEIKKSPPQLLKKFAGNMEEADGAVCMENLTLGGIWLI